MRILVVEDEKKVAKALRDGLEAHHYDVDVAATGEDGFFSWPGDVRPRAARSDAAEAR